MGLRGLFRIPFFFKKVIIERQEIEAISQPAKKTLQDSMDRLADEMVKLESDLKNFSERITTPSHVSPRIYPATVNIKEETTREDYTPRKDTEMKKVIDFGLCPICKIVSMSIEHVYNSKHDMFKHVARCASCMVEKDIGTEELGDYARLIPYNTDFRRMTYNNEEKIFAVKLSDDFYEGVESPIVTNKRGRGRPKKTEQKTVKGEKKTVKTEEKIEEAEQEGVVSEQGEEVAVPVAV